MSKLMQKRYEFSPTELELIDQIEASQNRGQTVESDDSVVVNKDLYTKMCTGINNYKQILKKAKPVSVNKIQRIEYTCPTCEAGLHSGLTIVDMNKTSYCPCCGQALDWGDFGDDWE